MHTPRQPTWPAAWAPQQPPAQHSAPALQQPPPQHGAPASHQAPVWPNSHAPQQYPAPVAYPQGPGQGVTPYPPPFPHRPHGEPLFTVRLRKHTGLGLAWVSQNYAVTGTFHQCEAAIKDAQRHNLVGGWWSIASIVLWNWIALAENANARKYLRQDARPYGYVPAPRQNGR